MRIGILGYGQLARMLAVAGLPLGLRFSFFTDTALDHQPLFGDVIHGSYTELHSLEAFAQNVDYLTFENENIPADLLKSPIIEEKLRPSINVLEVCQDRLFEKKLFSQLDIPTNGFKEINSRADLLSSPSITKAPFFIKKRTNGYDGKHQYAIRELSETAVLADEVFENALVESRVDFDREISIIAVASPIQEPVFYDLSQNHHIHGILDTTRNIQDDPYFPIACTYVQNIIQHFGYIGVIAVEFFQKGDTLYANEIAPRVHNSGHWTIDGAITSQFENHLRAICGMPLGSVTAIASTEMKNIIGKLPDINKLLANPNQKLHLYGKSERPNRKLGHVTNVMI